MLQYLLIVASALQIASAERIDVFGVAKCPDTSRFLRNQLAPFVEKFTDLPSDLTIEYHPVPSQMYLKGNKLISTCLHGELECKMNKLQACAKKLYPGDGLTTVLCVQGKGDYALASACLKADQKSKILACAESQDGEQLLKEEAIARGKYGQGSTWMPWISIDGTRSVEAEGGLEKVICGLKSMASNKKCDQYRK